MAPKAKAQKMSLGDFLGDQTLGSWADEMEDMPLTSDSRSGFSGERRAISSAGGFGDRSYDRGDRYAQREALPLPTKPPYTAHLGNLPFDATQEHIDEFFEGCEVTSVRIVEDKIERRPKGFGYVEFGTLEGLKKALELNMTQFRGRNIKISVADPPKDRPDRGEARELNDWTRKGPLPDLPNARRSSDRGGMRDGMRDAPEMERGGSRRGAPSFDGDGKVRDFGNWERKGPLSPLPNAEPMRGNGRVRQQHDGPRERKNSPSWGEGRSQDGSRPPRGEFRERPQPERQPTAADLDTEWRARMKPDVSGKAKSPTPDTSTPSSPKQAPALAVRPKLNLQKRTVSEQVEPNSAATPSDSKASPFGAARPIDTAARERQVEEKRQQALRQKREADEKAREEKRAKEAEAKAAASSDGENDAPQEDDKEDAAETSAPAQSYQILARMADEEDEENDEDEAQEAPKEPKDSKPNGVSNEGRPQKPRGPSREHREPPRGPKHQGSWRQRKHSTPSSPAVASSDNPEDDGWSTVGPTKGRGQRSRGGRMGGS